MNSITDLIRKKIENHIYRRQSFKCWKSYHACRWCCPCRGLSKVMYNEMVEFPNDVLGIALNLEEDSVGCVLLGDTSSLKEGDDAKTTGKLLSVPVGKVCWEE